MEDKEISKLVTHLKNNNTEFLMVEKLYAVERLSPKGLLNHLRRYSPNLKKDLFNSRLESLVSEGAVDRIYRGEYAISPRYKLAYEMIKSDVRTQVTLI